MIINELRVFLPSIESETDDEQYPVDVNIVYCLLMSPAGPRVCLTVEIIINHTSIKEYKLMDIIKYNII